MGTYLKYVFFGSIISALFPQIFCFLSLPLFGLAHLAAATTPVDGSAPPPASRLLGYVLMAVTFIGCFYLICGWSAYVAFFTHALTLSPSVRHDWLYFVTGFALCQAPLSYMASKDGRDAGPGNWIQILCAMVAYIGFCIWPVSAMLVYGWFLRLVI